MALEQEYGALPLSAVGLFAALKGGEQDFFSEIYEVGEGFQHEGGKLHPVRIF